MLLGQEAMGKAFQNSMESTIATTMANFSATFTAQVGGRLDEQANMIKGVQAELLALRASQQALANRVGKCEAGVIASSKGAQQQQQQQQADPLAANDPWRGVEPKSKKQCLSAPASGSQGAPAFFVQSQTTAAGPDTLAARPSPWRPLCW